MGYDRGYGLSSLSTKLVHLRGGTTVVWSCGDLSNWVRAGISHTLVILSNRILSESRIFILIDDLLDHIITLDVAAIQGKRWRTGRKRSV